MKQIEEKYLAIDIGGSHIKSTILNIEGKMEIDYQKIATPKNATPEDVVNSIETLIKEFPHYDKISVGFPGFIKNGVVKTAPNLNNEAFKNFNLSQAIASKFKKPVRLVNDADMQGLGVISRVGLEMVITLGTGFGTALFMDGKLLPHLELAHLPIKKGDYDDFIGDKALDQDGIDVWNEKVKSVLETFSTVINYDSLFLGGGNAKKINFTLNDNIKLVGNRDGIKGGIFLWKEEDGYCVRTVNPI
ncbi:chromosome partitioning protein ParA [Pedobacter psychrophilus]|uniref:Chromosome partitioning protein ParA n=1 Tax=Pedobacter psychrophilus TaxID=1826909 RepID=A0A179DEF0_9SPHI|nr:ROK family protein [Pedobacter psychrophilus]OAQ39274.1 chromosome partitioning protein ParA [Pedobacter psychrophilus]